MVLLNLGHGADDAENGVDGDQRDEDKEDWDNDKQHFSLLGAHLDDPALVSGTHLAADAWVLLCIVVPRKLAIINVSMLFDLLVHLRNSVLRLRLTNVFIVDAASHFSGGQWHFVQIVLHIFCRARSTMHAVFVQVFQQLFFLTSNINVSVLERIHFNVHVGLI